jgi:hypothetical protein
MSKPIRIVLACILFLLTISISVSAADPVQAQGATPPGTHIGVMLSFNYVWPTHMCVGDKGNIGIKYEWEGLRGVPWPSGGALYNQAKLGKIDKPTLHVDNGPGDLELTYTAKKAGTEKIESSLFYGIYSRTITSTINIYDCNYNLIINARDDKNQEDVIITSDLYADGFLQADKSNKVTGTIDYTAGINVTSDNDVMDCVMKPIVGRVSTITVTGTVTENTFSNTVHLNIAYKPVTLPSANEICVDKRKKIQIKNVPFNFKKPYDPARDLLTTLDFTIYGTRFSKITGSYGEGTAVYTLVPVVPANGQ